MDMKNTTILLIFLLCILGLMIGVYQTEGSDDAVNLDNYEEVVLEDSNGTITIQLEPIEKTESFLNRLFT
ncbi:MAG: hypothetical protein U0L42_06135 [Methanobrevibacter sp.]|uniref:hypothetical protein n=1 Tax=Methanobrevibacter sp. TaxID=66852 RepID=UPI002E77F0E9|nr:hypothetical protein [Methanobrevibacter sp.]MEE0935234.1 hypothetical protein [Methanobrevibacter sp.]